MIWISKTKEIWLRWLVLQTAASPVPVLQTAAHCSPFLSLMHTARMIAF